MYLLLADLLFYWNLDFCLVLKPVPFEMFTFTKFSLVCGCGSHLWHREPEHMDLNADSDEWHKFQWFLL